MKLVTPRIDPNGTCPKCSSSWDAGEIPEKHRHCYSPPYRYSRLIGVEISALYDGVWYWQCPDCDARFPRFEE